MINHKNSFNPSESQVPGDWPFRENSKMVKTNDFLWHVQIFKNQSERNRPLFLLIHGTGGAVHSWYGMVEDLHNKADLILMILPLRPEKKVINLSLMEKNLWFSMLNLLIN